MRIPTFGFQCNCSFKAGSDIWNNPWTLQEWLCDFNAGYHRFRKANFKDCTPAFADDKNASPCFWIYTNTTRLGFFFGVGLIAEWKESSLFTDAWKAYFQSRKDRDD